MKWQAWAIALALISLAGCTDDKQSSRVEFKTSLGDFTVEVWTDKSPITAENFLKYVEYDHYDGLTFHRVSPGFVIQGGGFLPDHTTQPATRAPIFNEASDDVKNLKWTLSMARTNSPHSATSQFFINLADNENLDPNENSAGYAVFGKVVEGRSVIEAMSQVTPGQSFGSAGGFFPAEPIVIHEARIISGPKPGPAKPATLTADTITPGKFSLTSPDEVIMVWARNTGEATGQVAWNLTGADGTALPGGWVASFEQPTTEVGGGLAEFTMLHLQVPDATTGTFDLELHTGSSVTAIQAVTAVDDEPIARLGDDATIQYRGECVKSGQEFDSGSFPTKLGPEGRAIQGFSYGLIGFAAGESGTIVIPESLAYGHFDGPCAELEPADLLFDVTLTTFS